MNLKNQIRELFPPAQRDLRRGLEWDIVSKTDELLEFIVDHDLSIIFKKSADIDTEKSYLEFQLAGEHEPLIRLDDRYAYYLRVLMAHLSVRLSETSGEPCSPYEGSGDLVINGHRIGVEFCNQPGNSCVHLTSVPLAGKTNQFLAAVA